MSVEELEEQVAKLRSHPLMVLCRTTSGRERPMTVKECARTGSAYLHVIADELDALLAAELGEANAYQE